MARSSPASYALPFSASSSFTSHGSSHKGIFTVKWIRRSDLRLPISPKYTDSPFSLVSSYGYSCVCSVKNPAVNPVSGRKPSDGILKFPSSSECDVSSSIWNWRGYRIRYQSSGKNGPALILIHGFGANSDHWRKNISFLSKTNRVYSIDLIGYGYSEKPNPRDFEANSFYTFETWAAQLNDFCADVVKEDAFFICNSIGGVVGLQAAIMEPQICKGILLLNISLRMLHIKKQPWYGRPFIKSFQSLLRNTELGKIFYNAVATKESVKSILFQCYHDKSAVTDELVQIILQPGLDPGAANVFLEFICYSGGPLPEDLLPKVKFKIFQCPVLVAWGDKDPWEPIELGKAFANFEAVEDFVVLPNVGHCPQDEAPDLVNPLIQSFVKRHSEG
ncbi:pheophytinase, chloroplastic isoform X1 [Dendrobium catenatum]|uniref:pheophytinase, chloroplastic isoform X1 n=1 Tax=Dendrobium catenatum TaxID=906689 RepID=UPI0009F3D710|nr:pheophytinase, chloroplastic isoform X1 [Dendrobium catenatum]